MASTSNPRRRLTGTKATWPPRQKRKEIKSRSVFFTPPSSFPTEASPSKTPSRPSPSLFWLALGPARRTPSQPPQAAPIQLLEAVVVEIKLCLLPYTFTLSLRRSRFDDLSLSIQTSFLKAGENRARGERELSATSLLLGPSSPVTRSLHLSSSLIVLMEKKL